MRKVSKGFSSSRYWRQPVISACTESDKQLSEKEFVDILVEFLKQNSIKKLMELVLKAIEISGVRN